MPTNPGSEDAKRLGCLCPRIDNAFGQGAVVDGKVDPDKFFTDPDCPVHTDARRLNAEPRGAIQSGGDDSVESAAGDTSGDTNAPALDNEPAGEAGNPT